jgi:hypothetical protein
VVYSLAVAGAYPGLPRHSEVWQAAEWLDMHAWRGATPLLSVVNGSAASLRPCSEGCCLPRGPACSPKLRPGRLRLRLLLTVCYCPPTHLPACRVWDNDGEFLLIEAAYGLPRWVKPETAQNRVWLHGGAFHLVPLPRFVGQHSGGGRCRGPALHVPAGMLALECQ